MLVRFAFLVELADLYRRGWELVEKAYAIFSDTPEVEHSSRALLDAGGTAHTFGVLHRFTLVGEVHDVDALVAN